MWGKVSVYEQGAVVEVAKELKKLRERAGYSMAKIAKALGYKGPSSYQRYENDTLFTKDYLPVELVEKLIPIFSGKGEPPIASGEILRLGGVHKIVNNRILEGLNLQSLKETNTNRVAPIITAQQIEMLSQRSVGLRDTLKYVSIEDDIGEHAFCLEVTDSSMSPEFKEGDRLICDPEAEIRPGNYVIAKLDHEFAASIRRYRVRGFDEKGKPIIDLVPVNPDYPTTTISAASPGRVYARVVEHRRRV